MKRYILTGFLAGLLFALMDGFIHANPYAAPLFSVFSPIARTSLNLPAGIFIDLAFGFVLAWLFCLLYGSLPGGSGIAKGISFGLIAWFFRVVMSAASQWMMYTIPPGTILYSLASGLFEMLFLGVVFGLALKPKK